MRTRLVTLAFGLYLATMILGCNKNPAQSTTDNTAPAATPAPADNSTAPAPAHTEAMKHERREERKEAPPAPLVVPAGTTFTVQLGQAVGSKISQNGQTFTATLANSVMVGDQTAIPSGATASGVIVDAKPLGRFAGGASLQLKLTSISVNGVDTAIETSSVTDTAKGKGKRTAVMAGGGAALGALIGGLAGGGKGAAIGALAGGGAGTGGAAFTGNKDIVLPAESSLSFKLEQPLTVKQ